MDIKHYLRSSDAPACFDPPTLDLLQRVVDEAWQELARRSASEITRERERLTRELMAHRVMARALRGELDPGRLKEHALWGL
jgi:hypothetical protein